jgi:hypothetical protein
LPQFERRSDSRRDVTARSYGDWSIGGEAFYDRIGVNDLDAYGGNVRISIPLN